MGAAVLAARRPLAVVVGGLAGFGLLRFFGWVATQGQYLTLSFHTWRNPDLRLTGVAWNPDYFALFLVLTIPTLVALALASGAACGDARASAPWRPRSASVALVFTFQRAAYLALVAALVALAVLLHRLRRAGAVRWLLAGLVSRGGRRGPGCPLAAGPRARADGAPRPGPEPPPPLADGAAHGARSSVPRCRHRPLRVLLPALRRRAGSRVRALLGHRPQPLPPPPGRAGRGRAGDLRRALRRRVARRGPAASGARRRPGRWRSRVLLAALAGWLVYGIVQFTFRVPALVYLAALLAGAAVALAPPAPRRLSRRALLVGLGSRSPSSAGGRPRRSAVRSRPATRRASTAGSASRTGARRAGRAGGPR